MPNTHLALQIDRMVRRIHASLHSKAEEFDVERIGPGGSMVLLTIDELGETTMAELARRTARDKSQMTRAVTALEAKGLVSRFGSSEDARVTCIRLTEKGEAAVALLQRALAEAVDATLFGVSAEEKASLGALIEKAVTPPR